MFFRKKPERKENRRYAVLSVTTLEDRVTPAAGTNVAWFSYPATSAFLLHSNPGANKVIYLDFNGHTTAGTQWNTQYNGGAPFTTPAWSMDANRAAFSTVELNKIIDMWRMVAEDFMPFNIDVTTQDPGVANLVRSNAADVKFGMRVVIGPDPGTVVSGSPTPWPMAGGLAYLNSFINANGTPCFVWNGDMRPNPENSLPDSVSHEVGHTLGLDHDGDTATGPGGYYAGHGVGVVSWGPIMGGPFGMNLTQWSRDTYPGADNPEDDLAIITTGHGFTYRLDDYGNTMATAKQLNAVGKTTFVTRYGIIERNTDADFFKVNLKKGAINLQIDALFIGPNLDIQANLYNNKGVLLVSSNGLNLIDGDIAITLPYTGAYYIRISGTGRPNPLVDGYTNYGSLGNYRIVGTGGGGPVTPPTTPTMSTLKGYNPVRWVLNPSTGTYDGIFTIANVTNYTFTGTFVFTFVLPQSVTVINGPGVQTGTQYKITFTGSITAANPAKFFVQLANPFNISLALYTNTYFSGFTYTP